MLLENRHTFDNPIDFARWWGGGGRNHIQINKNNLHSTFSTCITIFKFKNHLGLKGLECFLGGKLILLNFPIQLSKTINLRIT